MADISDKMKDTTQESLGFFKYVFNMDEDNKSKLFNMIQYVLIAIIPVVLLLKVVKDFMPEADETKSTIELLAESLGQVLFMFLCLWFIHKMIEFIPTYSGKQYSMFNESSFVLGFLILLFTMQTKLGEKIHILLDRLSTLWGGESETAKSRKGKRVNTQQQAHPQLTAPQPTHQPSQADNLGLPSSMPQVHPSMPTSLESQLQAPSPNFNQMYNNAPTQSPMDSGPMAANEAFGGSMFGGSSF